MKKQTTQTTEYIIEQDEIGTIKICLDYCSHRLNNHKCGISDYVNPGKLSEIRKTLNEKNDKEIFKKMDEDNEKFIIKICKTLLVKDAYKLLHIIFNDDTIKKIKDNDLKFLYWY